MKTLELNGSKELVMIDDEDYVWLSRFKWWMQNNENGENYVTTKVGKRVMCMHSLLLPSRSDSLVKYIDGNNLNLQKVNIKPASRSQIGANRNPNAGKKYKGAYLPEGEKRWRSQIVKDGVTYLLGSYETEEEAARAYDVKARELYGDYARLNFPKASEND